MGFFSLIFKYIEKLRQNSDEALKKKQEKAAKKEQKNLDQATKEYQQQDPTLELKPEEVSSELEEALRKALDEHEKQEASFQSVIAQNQGFTPEQINYPDDTEDLVKKYTKENGGELNADIATLRNTGYLMRGQAQNTQILQMTGNTVTAMAQSMGTMNQAQSAFLENAPQTFQNMVDRNTENLNAVLREFDEKERKRAKFWGAVKSGIMLGPNLMTYTLSAAEKLRVQTESLKRFVGEALGTLMAGKSIFNLIADSVPWLGKIRDKIYNIAAFPEALMEWLPEKLDNLSMELLGGLGHGIRTLAGAFGIEGDALPFSDNKTVMKYETYHEKKKRIDEAAKAKSNAAKKLNKTKEAVDELGIDLSWFESNNGVITDTGMNDLRQHVANQLKERIQQKIDNFRVYVDAENAWDADSDSNFQGIKNGTLDELSNIIEKIALKAGTDRGTPKTVTASGARNGIIERLDPSELSTKLRNDWDSTCKDSNSTAIKFWSVSRPGISGRLRDVWEQMFGNATTPVDCYTLTIEIARHVLGEDSKNMIDSASAILNLKADQQAAGDTSNAYTQTREEILNSFATEKERQEFEGMIDKKSLRDRMKDIAAGNMERDRALMKELGIPEQRYIDGEIYMQHMSEKHGIAYEEAMRKQKSKNASQRPFGWDNNSIWMNPTAWKTNWNIDLENNEKMTFQEAGKLRSYAGNALQAKENEYSLRKDSVLSPQEREKAREEERERVQLQAEKRRKEEQLQAEQARIERSRKETEAHKKDQELERIIQSGTRKGMIESGQIFDADTWLKNSSKKSQEQLAEEKSIYIEEILSHVAPIIETDPEFNKELPIHLTVEFLSLMDIKHLLRLLYKVDSKDPNGPRHFLIKRNRAFNALDQELFAANIHQVDQVSYQGVTIKLNDRNLFFKEIANLTESEWVELATIINVAWEDAVEKDELREANKNQASIQAMWDEIEKEADDIEIEKLRQQSDEALRQNYMNAKARAAEAILKRQDDAEAYAEKLRDKMMHDYDRAKQSKDYAREMQNEKSLEYTKKIQDRFHRETQSQEYAQAMRDRSDFEHQLILERSEQLVRNLEDEEYKNLEKLNAAYKKITGRDYFRASQMEYFSRVAPFMTILEGSHQVQKWLDTYDEVSQDIGQAKSMREQGTSSDSDSMHELLKTIADKLDILGITDSTLVRLALQGDLSRVIAINGNGSNSQSTPGNGQDIETE